MRFHLTLLGLILFGVATLATAQTCTKHYVNLPGWPPKTLICQTCCSSTTGDCKTTCW
jgi:hypothetical protein